MRIGILQADHVDEEYRDRFGDYPEMFVDTLGRAADAAEFEFFDVQKRCYPARVDDCDGYLITGSRASVYDDEPWIDELGEFVRNIDRAGVRTVGICFGHQLIAQALGGQVGPAPSGWGVGVHSWNVVHTEPWMRPSLGEFKLLASHRDQVDMLPDAARLVASSPFCPNAAFVIDDRLLGVQGHPEFTKDYAALLLHRRREQLGPAFAPGLHSLDQTTDACTVAAWIMGFLRGED